MGLSERQFGLSCCGVRRTSYMHPKKRAGEVEVEVEAGAKAKPKAKGKAKAKRGRKTVWFEKCSWAEMSAHPQALTLVTLLLLTADSLHSR